MEHIDTDTVTALRMVDGEAVKIHAIIGVDKGASMRVMGAQEVHLTLLTHADDAEYADALLFEAEAQALACLSAHPNTMTAYRG